MLQARDGYLAELEELIPTMEALVAEKMSLEEQAEQMKARLRGLKEAGHEVCLGFQRSVRQLSPESKRAGQAGTCKHLLCNRGRSGSLNRWCICWGCLRPYCAPPSTACQSP